VSAYLQVSASYKSALLFLWSAAEKSETRQARIEKCMPRILDGLGLEE